MRNIALTAVAIIALAGGGCASSYLDGKEMHHAYWSAHGVISVEFWKQDDGSYLVSATGIAEKKDQEILDAWLRFVKEIARGRSFQGEPTLREFEHKKGYSMVLPQRMGEIERLKRASGTVIFSGEIKR